LILALLPLWTCVVGWIVDATTERHVADHPVFWALFAGSYPLTLAALLVGPRKLAPATRRYLLLGWLAGVLGLALVNGARLEL
jgi:hypothetical protein